MPPEHKIFPDRRNTLNRIEISVRDSVLLLEISPMPLVLLKLEQMSFQKTIALQDRDCNDPEHSA
jgi:hypothetical protein